MACLLFHWTKLTQAWLAIGTWSLYKRHCTVVWGMRIRMAVSCLVLTYQLMIMQNFANYSKFSETLVPSSALVYPTYVCSLSTSFTICVRPAECTTHYCCGLFLWFLCNFVSWLNALILVKSTHGHQQWFLAPSGTQEMQMSVHSFSPNLSRALENSGMPLSQVHLRSSSCSRSLKYFVLFPLQSMT